MFGRVAPVCSFHRSLGTGRFKHFVECAAGVHVEVVIDERHFVAFGVPTFREVGHQERPVCFRLCLASVRFSPARQSFAEYEDSCYCGTLLFIVNSLSML